jgi:hypothetical protein
VAMTDTQREKVIWWGLNAVLIAAATAFALI